MSLRGSKTILTEAKAWLIFPAPPNFINLGFFLALATIHFTLVPERQKVQIVSAI